MHLLVSEKQFWLRFDIAITENNNLIQPILKIILPDKLSKVKLSKEIKNKYYFLNVKCQT